MKKLYAILAAALMSASIYAGTAPTAADLAAEYDVTNNVVFCINFIDDATVCRDVRFVGTPNNWGKGEGSTEGWDNCEKFAPVPGFEGWYAAELPYAEGFEGKPLHEPEDRSWTWDFQCGDVDAWVHVDGLELTLTPGFADECNIKAGAAGAYIYQLKYWKAHNNPCVAQIPHDYTIKLYAPDACGDKPALIGDFNGWNDAAPAEMLVGYDADLNTVYSYTFHDVEGHGFKVVSMPAEGEKVNWGNQMWHYDTENDNWYEGGNEKLGATEEIVLNWGDNTLHRFGQCTGETPENVIVILWAPLGAPEEGVDVIGTFDGWSGTLMTYNAAQNAYAAEIEAKASDTFKFRQGGDESWTNEIQVFDGESWKNMDALKFDDVWFDASAIDPTLAGYMGVAIDLSDPDLYKWTANAAGIENVVLGEKAQKVVIDGVLYIIRDNKMYNAQGTQVR